MPQTDVTAANRRLAGAESFTIAPSKYLGHYVAGNLAARHNIHVTLDNSPGNGITATIDLPPTLLTSDAGPRPRGHAAARSPSRAAGHAGGAGAARRGRRVRSPGPLAGQGPDVRRPRQRRTARPHAERARQAQRP